MQSLDTLLLDPTPTVKPVRPARRLVQGAHSNDIDDQAVMLAGWEQHYIQFENGPFEAAVQSAVFPNSLLFRKSTNRKLYKRFAPPRNGMAFAALLAGSDPAVFQGKPAQAGDVLLIRGGCEHELICHGALNVVVAFLDEQADLPGLHANPGMHPPIIAGARAARFGVWLDGILHGSAGHGEDADVGELQGEMARRCVDLVYSHDWFSADIQRNERAKPTRIISALREFVISHLRMHDEIPTLARVVKELGVSIRVLEYTCKSLFDVSPQRYLTCWRLHCARRDIRIRAGSVTDIALKWGFSHLGRFSIAYRELFGERPSETLAMSRIGVARY